MVSQHELNRVRVEVMLPCKILFIIFPDIMFDQGNRNYKRYEPFVIIFYHFQ